MRNNLQKLSAKKSPYLAAFVKQKNILFYLFAFTLLGFVFFFFNNAYRQLIRYSELSNRVNKVYGCFVTLSKQVNNAAVINPDFMKAEESFNSGDLFYTDSLLVIKQLDFLKATVRDSVNIQIAHQLDTCIRAELSWMLKSNVPDSILHHRSTVHIAALRYINALIAKGIARTEFVIQNRKQMLDETIIRVELWMIIFILLSGLFLVYTTTGLFRQKSKIVLQTRELEEQQDLFASIVNSSDDAILSKNLEGMITSWNHGAEKVFAYSAKEIIGKPISILIPSYLQNEESEILNKIKQGESVDHYKTERIRKDGETIFVSLTVSPIRDSSGTIIGASKISRDITAQKKAEEKISKANRLYTFISAINQSIVHINNEKALLNNACKIAVQIGQFKTSWIGIMDEKGLLNMVNVQGDAFMTKEIQKYSGMDYSSTSLINTTTGTVLNTGRYVVKNDLQNDADMRTFKEIFVEHGIKSTISFPIKKFGKTIGVFGFHSVTENYFDKQEINLLEEAANDVSYALEVFEQERLRKKAEGEILKLNRLYAFISAINQSIVHIKEEKAILINACEVAMDIGGFLAARIGMLDENNRLILISTAGDDEVEKLLDKNVGKDFSIMELRNTPTGKVLSTGQYAVSNDTDTDPDLDYWRKDMLKNGIRSSASFPIKKLGRLIGVFSLLSSEKNFFDREEIKLLEEVSNDLSFALDNFENEKNRKQSEENLLNSEVRFRDFFENAPEGLTILEGKTGLFKKYNANALKVLKYKDDELFSKTPVDLSPPFQPDGSLSGEKAMQLIQATMLGERPVFEWLVKNGQGEEIMVELRMVRLSGADSNNILASFVDITERKQSERQKEKMMEDIVLRNKNLEQFSYIVSHNLRLPLANILGFIDILQEEDLPKEIVKDINEGLYKSAKKLDNVIKDLTIILQVKQNVNEKKELINFSSLANDIEISIETLIAKENVTFTWDFSEVTEMMTIKSYLHSIFYNLISNSIKYRQLDVPLLIEIKSQIINNKMILLFKDNGLGIDLKKQNDNVFGLYKRFHIDHAEGKGMGLYMVKTQVETIGGSISIKSEVNKGTEFRIEFSV